MITSQANVAVFINVDSLAGRYGADLHAADILRELRRFGDVQAAFAYGDWVRQRRLQFEFDAAGFRLVTMPRGALGEGEDWTDESHVTQVEQAFRISLDALEFALSHPRIDAIAIGGTSPLYAKVTRRLRTHGLRLIGIGPEDEACAPWAAACHRYVYGLTMVGRPVPAATFEEGGQRLSRLLAERAARGLGVLSPEALSEALLIDDPAFDPRNYGCPDLEAWLANYAHLLDRRPAQRRQDLDAEPTATPERPEPTPAESVARAILMRALVEGAWQGFPMSLATFRDTVQAVAPDFREKDFGFPTFLACLEAFPDLVIIDRNAWQVSANDGVIPDNPKLPSNPRGRGESPDVERRRPRRDLEADPHPESP